MSFKTDFIQKRWIRELACRVEKHNPSKREDLIQTGRLAILEALDRGTLKLDENFEYQAYKTAEKAMKKSLQHDRYQGDDTRAARKCFESAGSQRWALEKKGVDVDRDSLAEALGPDVRPEHVDIYVGNKYSYDIDKIADPNCVSPEQELINKETIDTLTAYGDSLEGRDADVFDLLRGERTRNEIAERHGVSPQAVSQWAAALKTKMQRDLKDLK